MTFLGPIGLVAATATMLALPIVPALHELWTRGDAAPLPTSTHDGNIANFSDVLRLRLAPLLAQLERCMAARELGLASAGGIQVLLVGSEGFAFHPHLTKSVGAVICGRPAVVPQSTVVESDIYALDSVVIGTDSRVRAVLGVRDVVLQEGSAVLRWLDATNVQLREDSSSYGRMSARESIRLVNGCTFERMRAPVILTGDADPAVLPVGMDVADLLDPSRPRMRGKGDFVVPAGETLKANVIASGELRLDRGARIAGSTKSYSDTVLEPGAQVRGSMVCARSVYIGAGCFVTGPIMAENEVVIGPGCRVGMPDVCTTVSARRVRIAEGCALHGTVWARLEGAIGD